MCSSWVICCVGGRKHHCGLDAAGSANSLGEVSGSWQGRQQAAYVHVTLVLEYLDYYLIQARWSGLRRIRRKAVEGWKETVGTVGPLRDGAGVVLVWHEGRKEERVDVVRTDLCIATHKPMKFVVCAPIAKNRYIDNNNHCLLIVKATRTFRN